MTTQVEALQPETRSPESRSGGVTAALTFMFIGNIVIGAGVMAPAAMINGMTADLGVSPVDIGALIGWGAMVLCIGAPAFGFFTNRVGRRTLLAASLILYAVGHGVSVFVSDYDTLLIVRLLMISGAAIFTPQAASAVSLMVPESKRAGAVALVFMGWAVAGAVVAPMMSLFAETISWRVIYAGLAIGAAVSAIGVIAAVPGALYTARMSLAAWGGVITRPAILILLATTSLQMGGQFVLYPYLAAELRRVTQADATNVAIVFGLYGAAGLFGSIVATRTVNSLGAARTHLVCMACLMLGFLGWTLFSSTLVLAAVFAFVWGLGFGAGVSMQQARLIAVAPPLASASVALNTSVLYLGQAFGSAIGGALIAQNAPHLLGPAGLTLLSVAAVASLWAYRRFKA